MNNNITATTNSDGVLVIPAGSLPSGGSSIEDESVVIKGTVSASSNSTKSLTITNSLIKADNINLPLTYGNTSTSTSGNITLTNSYMLWTGLTGNKFIKLSSILGSTIIAKKAPTASENDRVYLMTQPGGSITSHRDKPSVIEGVFCHELLGQPGTYSNTKYIDCGSNILNNTGGRIDIRGISFAPGSLRGSDGDSYDAVIGTLNRENSLHFYSCNIRPNRIAVRDGNIPNVSRAFFYQKVSETLYIDYGGTPLRNAKVIYTRKSADNPFKVICTTDENGVVMYNGSKGVDLLVAEAKPSGSIENSGITGIGNIRNYNLVEYEYVRTVLHDYTSLEEYNLSLSLGEDIGATAGVANLKPYRVSIGVDLYKIEREVPSEGVTYSINRSGSSPTLDVRVDIGVRGTISLQEIYHLWRKHLLNNHEEYEPNLMKMSRSILVLNGTLTIVSGTIVDVGRVSAMKVNSVVTSGGTIDAPYTTTDKPVLVIRRNRREPFNALLSVNGQREYISNETSFIKEIDEGSKVELLVWMEGRKLIYHSTASITTSYVIVPSEQKYSSSALDSTLNISDLESKIRVRVEDDQRSIPGISKRVILSADNGLYKDEKFRKYLHRMLGKKNVMEAILDNKSAINSSSIETIINHLNIISFTKNTINVNMPMFFIEARESGTKDVRIPSLFNFNLSEEISVDYNMKGMGVKTHISEPFFEDERISREQKNMIDTFVKTLIAHPQMPTVEMINTRGLFL